MKSIYGKLIIGYLVSILFSFTVAGYFSVRKNFDELSKVAIEELEASTSHIANLISLIDEEDIEDVLHGYAESSEIRFYVLSDGNVTYNNLDQELNTQQKNLLKESGNQTIISNSSVRKMVKSFDINGETFIVYVQKDISQREKTFMSSIFIAVVCMLIAGSITFLVIADIIVKPVSRLTKATNELSKGNYRVRVNYAGTDEIATLNRSFNLMAQQLAKQEETRQQFISDVSHEFQTPLTAIQGFATILKNEDLPEALRKKYADIILFHSKRLSGLSKNMLQLTLLEGEDVKMELSEYSLVEQMKRVIETQDNLAISKDIEIEFIEPKNDIVIFADEARLEQVWTNLLNNAIKYTDDHGVVTINMKKTVKFVEVSIQDTGIGMSKEAISHIFERFYRSDKSRSIEGNGLGLSIVKRIVELHHGTIDVSSIEDGGSEFSVKLPQEKIYLIPHLNIKKKE